MAVGAFSGALRGAAHQAAGRGVAVALCLALALALGACNARRNQTVPVASAADLPAMQLSLSQPAKPAAVAAPAETAPATTALATTDGIEGETVETAPTETAALPGDATADDVRAEDDVAPAEENFVTAAPADPKTVMGLGRSAVEALLGEPGLVRREAPAEVWQYQSGGCVLDVFLYQAASDFEVVYLEARTGQAVTAATANCLGSVMDHRRATPSS